MYTHTSLKYCGILSSDITLTTGGNEKPNAGFHLGAGTPSVIRGEKVTSVQEESHPVDDETDEDEDNSNDESSKGFIIC
ncbi:hypothetical protein TNCV_3561031 [Trichonephila clavipes]|nr:hypothetical protein TNCV_3561031 [Trichonephila clavipes]